MFSKVEKFANNCSLAKSANEKYLYYVNRNIFPFCLKMCYSNLIFTNTLKSLDERAEEFHDFPTIVNCGYPTILRL